MDFFNWSVELLMSSSDARQDTSTASLLSRSLTIKICMSGLVPACYLSLSLSVASLPLVCSCCDLRPSKVTRKSRRQLQKWQTLRRLHNPHSPRSTNYRVYRRPSSITTQPFFHYASYHNPAVAKGGSTWAQFARDRNRDKWKSWLKLAYLCTRYLPLCLPPRHIFVQIC